MTRCDDRARSDEPAAADQPRIVGGGHQQMNLRAPRQHGGVNHRLAVVTRRNDGRSPVAGRGQRLAERRDRPLGRSDEHTGQRLQLRARLGMQDELPGGAGGCRRRRARLTELRRSGDMKTESEVRRKVCWIGRVRSVNAALPHPGGRARSGRHGPWYSRRRLCARWRRLWSGQIQIAFGIDRCAAARHLTQLRATRVMAFGSGHRAGRIVLVEQARVCTGAESERLARGLECILGVEESLLIVERFCRASSKLCCGSRSATF